MRRIPSRALLLPSVLYLAILAFATPVLAQNQENVTEGGASGNGSQASSGTNEHGWPTDYVAQVGAGVTNGVTTGYSGSQETGGGEISLPPLPSADLCSRWEGTDAHAFCMDKVVQE